jgi:uncharacterized protein
VCSLGTGTTPVYIPGHDLDWGLAHWAKPLVSLMSDGVMGVAEDHCACCRGDRYCRLPPRWLTPIALDEVAATGDLIAAADQVDLPAAVAGLNAHCPPSASMAVCRRSGGWAATQTGGGPQGREHGASGG